jgi:hypothetical protein
MASAELHQTKYETFRNDAENEDVSIPLRIEAYFYASFHRIESVVAISGIHINRHQHVRRVLETHPDILWSRYEKHLERFSGVRDTHSPGTGLWGCHQWRKSPAGD